MAVLGCSPSIPTIKLSISHEQVTWPLAAGWGSGCNRTQWWHWREWAFTSCVMYQERYSRRGCPWVTGHAKARIMCDAKRQAVGSRGTKQREKRQKEGWEEAEASMAHCTMVPRAWISYTFQEKTYFRQQHIFKIFSQNKGLQSARTLAGKP